MEELVPRRWRERSKRPVALQRGELDGCRLHPHIWSTRSACVEAGMRIDSRLTAASLRQREELRIPTDLGLAARTVYVREVAW